MNPKLVKFSVELQTGEKIEEKKKESYFSNAGKFFFSLHSTSPIVVHVDEK